MIPQNHIIEWSNYVPWQTNEQIEQDLVICRALVEIFNDDFLAERLAFRGGTALHKLYLQPQPRYSEDIDLVQINAEPIKETIMRLQERLSFLGTASVIQKKSNNTLKFRFESEIPPTQSLRLKIETNCREHFTVLDRIKKDFTVKSNWFSGSCSITTYELEELLGSKLRVLYQRRKGRDLFDLHRALSMQKVNTKQVIKCYEKYMSFVASSPPTPKEFLKNMDQKIDDPRFVGDITLLLRPEEEYDHHKAYELVKTELIEKL